MKVFLIRHGVTQDAIDKKSQSPNSPLNKEGIKQARAAGKRLLKENINIVLSSKWKRARETAEIIASELGKEIELFEGIHEKERGEWAHGLHRDSDFAKEHDIEVRKSWGDLDWKFKGEGESIRQVIKRATKFRDHLILNHKNQNVLIVSHSGFIRTFISFVILGDDFSEEDYMKLWSAIPISNTGISLLEHGEGEWSDIIPWTLVYLNDHLHLTQAKQ